MTDDKKIRDAIEFYKDYIDCPTQVLRDRHVKGKRWNG
jgi:hypothetical protein